MWKNIAKQVPSKKRLINFSPNSIIDESSTHLQLSLLKNSSSSAMGTLRNGEILMKEKYSRRLSFSFLGNPNSLAVFSNYARGYATDPSSSTPTNKEEMVDELVGLLKDIDKLKKKRIAQVRAAFQPQEKKVDEMLRVLMTKKAKFVGEVETEAWEQAAKEYSEFSEDMCKYHRAPYLPDMKMCVLSWFKPFRDSIVEEQELCRRGEAKSDVHEPYFDRLSADVMAVITIHKLVGLMKSKGENGCVKVFEAASYIGGCIEQEQMKHIGKGQNNMKPWSMKAQAEVGSRLIELLSQTAYVRSPINQSPDNASDVRPRPAFVHKIITKDAEETRIRYAVIECDQLVGQWPEGTASAIMRGVNSEHGQSKVISALDEKANEKRKTQAKQKKSFIR